MDLSRSTSGRAFLIGLLIGVAAGYAVGIAAFVVILSGSG